MKALNTILLNLRGCENLTCKGVTDLSNNIKSFKILNRLSTLSLDLSNWTDLEDNDVFHLTQNLKYLQNLNNLYLNFPKLIFLEISE